MRPELFTLPFLPISIKSYGAMMVLGFLAALWMARRRCKNLHENPLHVTNFAAYALLAGVIGARIMHVLHNWPSYKQNPQDIFAIWSGGLEFLGGLVLAMIVMFIYFKIKKLPILKFLDILAPATMLGLAFGRVGCLLNGCCFGAPCQLPWAIQFPAVNNHTHIGAGCEEVTQTRYSYPYDYQLHPDQQRRPDQPPLLQLPDDFYQAGYTDGQGDWIYSLDNLSPEQRKKYYRAPKPTGQLTEEQLHQLQDNQHPMHPIHPSQIYSILNALFLCLILNILFKWRKYNGFIISWMLVLYGTTRFSLELIRVEPPEWFGLTIPQNMGLATLLLGVFLFIYLPRFHRPVKK